MIGDYLAHSVTWRQVGARDFYGTPTTEDTVIRVRWEGRRALVRASNGEQVVSEAKVYTIHPVAIGDILVRDGKEWPVIRVTEISGLDGELQHREVAL